MHPLKSGLLLLVVVLSFLSCFNKYARVFEINADKAAQLEATVNWANGKGLVIEEVDVHDLAKSEYHPLIGWPPGYSVLMLGLHPLTGDYIVSTNILNVIFLLGYLVLCGFILRMLNVSYWGIVLFYAFTAVSNQPLQTMTTTDLISFNLFLLMFYWLLRGLKQELSGWKFYLALACLGFVSAFVKYNFLPFVFLFPLAILMIGLFQRNRALILGGIICAVCMTVLIGAYLGYQKYLTGHYTYLSAYAEGTRLYVENLRKHSPFLFEFLFVEDPFKILSLKLPAIVTAIPTAATVILLMGAGLVALKRGREFFKLRAMDSRSFAILFGAVVMVLNVTMLVYLSLTNPLQEEQWTYVEEFRYYAPACFFFLLYILLSLTHEVRGIRLAAWTLIATSVGFGLANKVYKFKTYGVESILDSSNFNLRGGDHTQVGLLREVQRVVEKNPGMRVVYGEISSSQRLMAIVGAHPIWKFADFTNVDTVSSSAPTIVLTGVYDGQPKSGEAQLRRKLFREVYRFGDARILRLDISDEGR